MPGRMDFLVELRGFEPMAIAGVGIRQSREFHARAGSRLHSRKSCTEQRRRVFFDHGSHRVAGHVLPAGEALYMRYAGRRFQRDKLFRCSSIRVLGELAHAFKPSPSGRPNFRPGKRLRRGVDLVVVTASGEQNEFVKIVGEPVGGLGQVDEARGGTRFESGLFTNFAPESDFFSSLLDQPS